MIRSMIIDINAVATHISNTNIGYALRTLRDNKAAPIKKGNYIGIVDPYVEMDLLADTTFVDRGKYADSEKSLYNGEIGRWKGITWLRATQPWRQAVNSYQYAAAGAVHVVPIMGAEALGCIDLKSQGQHIIIHKDKTKEDALDQYFTIGWKFINVVKVILMCSAAPLSGGQMPLYDYECPLCEVVEFDVYLHSTESDERVCTDCGTKMKKLFPNRVRFNVFDESYRPCVETKSNLNPEALCGEHGAEYQLQREEQMSGISRFGPGDTDEPMPCTTRAMEQKRAARGY